MVFTGRLPSFLELENTKVTPDVVEVEMRESKKNYLHPVAGSSAEKIGVGLFLKRENKE